MFKQPIFKEEIHANPTTVEREQKKVELSARDLLAEILFRHRDQVLSREILFSRVWGYDFDPGSSVVDVYVGYLRKKLGKDLIETVRGMGYRLVDHS